MKCLCSFIHHTIWDEQEPFLHIDIVDCILTGFMKKMQCNALNIITVAKQVWCYFICGTMHPGCAGTIKYLQIVLNTPKKSLLKSSYPKKILAKIFLPKKNPKSKISNPKN